jgi:hypothetical protein
MHVHLQKQISITVTMHTHTHAHKGPLVIVCWQKWTQDLSNLTIKLHWIQKPNYKSQCTFICKNKYP